MEITPKKYCKWCKYATTKGQRFYCTLKQREYTYYSMIAPRKCKDYTYTTTSIFGETKGYRPHPDYYGKTQ